MTSAPGPKSLPFVGGALQLRGDPLRVLCALSREYGGVVHLGSTAGRPLFLLSEPAPIKHVLQDNNKNYIKGRSAKRMAPVFGDGLLLAEGDSWRRQRRLAQPAFHRQHIAEMSSTFTEGAQELLRAWEPLIGSARSIDITEEMLRLTMKLTVRTMFHADITSRMRTLIGAWEVLYRDLSRHRWSIAQTPRWVPRPANRRYRASIDAIDRILLELITERRRSQDDGSLLGMLVHARDENGGPGLDDRQLRDEVMTLFIGGYESSSNALAFTWAMLCTHADVARRHQAELAAVLGGRAPTIEDLQSLPYNRMVLEETMRLYPPSWTVTREALADDEIGGFHVPRGSQLLLSQYATHHNPAVWSNPESFDPERFAKGAADERARFAYFPFGGGPRQCLGDLFSLVEMQLVIATIAQHVRLDLVPGTTITPFPGFLLRPRESLRMFVTPRATSSSPTSEAPR